MSASASRGAAAAHPAVPPGRTRQWENVGVSTSELEGFVRGGRGVAHVAGTCHLDAAEDGWVWVGGAILEERRSESPF